MREYILPIGVISLSALIGSFLIFNQPKKVQIEIKGELINSDRESQSVEIIYKDKENSTLVDKDIELKSGVENRKTQGGSRDLRDRYQKIHRDRVVRAKKAQKLSKPQKSYYMAMNSNINRELRVKRAKESLERNFREIEKSQIKREILNSRDRNLLFQKVGKNRNSEGNIQ